MEILPNLRQEASSEAVPAGGAVQAGEEGVICLKCGKPMLLVNFIHNDGVYAFTNDGIYYCSRKHVDDGKPHPQSKPGRRGKT